MNAESTYLHSSGWSDEDFDLLLVWLVELIRRRNAAGVTVPAQMQAMAQRLDLQVLSRGMSAVGHELCSSDPPLADELIGTREAARILGVTARQVRRRVPDLDGEMVGGRMLFRRSVVIEYQQSKECT